MINEILIDDKDNIYKSAILYRDVEISYSDLSIKTNSFSTFLIKQEYLVGDRVLVYLERSIDAIIAMYGIIKAGLVYVPIDPKTPAERFSSIVEDCMPCMIIFDTNTNDTVRHSKACENISLLYVDEIDEKMHWSSEKIYSFHDIVADIHEDLLENRATPHDLAYIIYTSGSTGIPKGVMIRRESILGFVKKYTRYMKYDSNTRMLGITSLSGDGSFIQYFCTHLAGGMVAIHHYKRPNLLTKFLYENQITDIDCSATIVKILGSKFSFLSKYKLDQMKTISYGGDLLATSFMTEIKKYIPSVKFFNGYGPTECTVLVTLYGIDDEEIYHPSKETIPIGRAFEGVELIALNSSNKPISCGERGELLIGGNQLMEGYWKDEVLSKKCLIPHPFKEGNIVFKTGDIVTIDNKGNYVFLMRKNNMIKINGYRVYLTEVENVIKSHPDIRDCFVSAMDDKYSGVRLTAYLVLEDGKRFEIQLFKTVLSNKMPSYMLPSEFKVIDSFPILPNGKLDKKALTLL